MKLILLIVVLIFVAIPSSASTKITLEDALPPENMTVDKNNLYLSSGIHVTIFSLKDLKVVKMFGTKGEGPGEFLPLSDDRGMTLEARTDKLLVISRRKISFFTKKGEFIKEIKVKTGFSHLPVAENFVATSTKQIEKMVYRTVNIYDKEFNVIKNIHRIKHWYQQGKSINPLTVRPPYYCSDNDKVFCENGKGNVNIFDKNGEQTGSTSLEISRVKVSEQDKRDYHYYYKTHPVYKGSYEALRHLVKFPDYYPRIKYFDVANGNIYILSHVKKGGKSEWYICDLKGELQKKVYVDMPELDPQSVFPIIKVRNQKIYQIIENEEDDEAIDLFITAIR